MGVEREKDWFLPEAQGDGIFVPWQPQAPEDDDAPPDPWERPDLPDLDGEQAPPWSPEIPVEPCPCCGADIPQNPSWGYICPTCLWEIDYDAQDASEEPSDQNHGLSLEEARMNFRTFGCSNPWLIERENE